jgi:asparagine synthase (glutamine-hydrolysing)
VCGITGFCDFRKISDIRVIQEMSDTLKHRGPDAGNAFYQSYTEYNIGLGHRRLSIIDLSEKANQPMEYDNLVIIYNGEVYNFKEIRKELEKVGYAFLSSSDTEVVLKAFHFWGQDALNKFNGMFAFCIFDKKNEQIYLARDRAGVKPLFYYFNGNILLFGSELKSMLANPLFKKELDFDSLGIYLNCGYIPTPHSIFKYTSKLLPGSILIFDIETKKYSIKEYWRIQDFYNQPKNTKSTEDIINEIESVLTDSLRLRLISDVPIGIFLSGGYDSTLLAAILRKKINVDLKAYTMSVADKNLDESVRASEIANHLGLKHQIHTISEKEAQNILLDFPVIYDEPYADTSGIPTIFLSSLIKNDGIKVVLTGDGAEETFAGYDIYYQKPAKLDRLKFLPKAFKKLMLLFYSQNKYLCKYPFDYYSFINNYFDLGEKLSSNFKHPLLSNESIIKENFFGLFTKINNQNTYHDKLLARDFRTRMLDDFICKIDRGTMSESIEAREPFLDYRLIEFLASIPAAVKCTGKQTKYLLKQLTHKYVPANIMNKPKKGFTIPIDEWFTGDLKFLINEYLDDSIISRKEYINKEYVKSQKGLFFEKKLNYEKKFNLIFLLFFEMWYKKWISDS